MFDPNQPLVGQNTNQPPQGAIVANGMTREQLDAADDARLNRKFGFKDNTPVAQAIPQAPTNQQQTEPNPFTGLSATDRQEIVNSFVPQPTNTAQAGPELSQNVNQNNTQEQDTQGSNDGDLFDDIFGSTNSILGTGQGNADTQPHGDAQQSQQSSPAQETQGQVDPFSQAQNNFRTSMVNASLDLQVNPNDVMQELEQLQPSDLVKFVMERKTSRGNGASNHQAPQQQAQPMNYIEKIASKSIFGADGDQVPRFSTESSGPSYDDLDKF